MGARPCLATWASLVYQGVQETAPAVCADFGRTAFWSRFSRSLGTVKYPLAAAMEFRLHAVCEKYRIWPSERAALRHFPPSELKDGLYSTRTRSRRHSP